MQLLLKLNSKKLLEILNFKNTQTGNMKKIITIILIGAIYACGGGDANKKKAELDGLKKQQAELKEKIQKLEAELAVNDSANSKSKLVGFTDMQLDTFNHFIEVQAKVEGDEDVMLSPQSMGTVTNVMVKAGDKVSNGQVLAVIDDRLVRQGMSELQSQLDLALQLYSRQKNLWDQKIGSEVQFLQAKTNKDAMERRMDVMKEQLDMTRIKAPISGTIDEVSIKVGQSVAPGVPAIRLVNLSALKVRGEIAESYIDRVKKGNPVILYFPDQKKEVKTIIDYSGNRIDPLNRTFNVEVRLNDKEGTLRPNMITIMKIVDYSNKKAFILPIDAVQKSTDGEFVYVVANEGNKTVAKRKIVKSGLIYNGFTEITSGLETGDKVVTKGFHSIIENDPIQI